MTAASAQQALPLPAPRVATAPRARRTDPCAGCRQAEPDGTCRALLNRRLGQAVGDWLIQQPGGMCPGRRSKT